MSLSASVCSRLQHHYETIQQLLNGSSEEQWRQRIHKVKWSAFEQVAYLVLNQPVFLQENNAQFDRYVANNDPAFIAGCKKVVNRFV